MTRQNVVQGLIFTSGRLTVPPATEPLSKVWLRRNLRTEAPVYRIRHAAKMAGINPTLLRAWERRYHLVEPTRTPSGYRVYTPADIEVLRAAAQLVAAGHSISEIARLPRAELEQAAQTLLPLPRGASDLDRPLTAPLTAGDDEVPAAAREPELAASIKEALSAVQSFDRERFEAALFPLTTAGLGPVALCERVLLPLLEAIGDAWEQGDLSVAAEHFGSALCRAKILQYLEFMARGASGPRVVCACPENELHEGGLMAFAVHAAAARWQVIYLGTHTPVDQALGTAVRIRAAMLAISLTSPRRPADIQALLTRVAEARSNHPQLRVVAGGRTAQAHRQQLEDGGVEVANAIAVRLDAPSASATTSDLPGGSPRDRPD